MKKLPNPQSQTQEVLYELIYRLNIDRRTIMLSCDVFNLPARIYDLRRLGLSIQSNKVTILNRFKRETTYIQYSLNEKKDAHKVYMKLFNNSELYNKLRMSAKKSLK